MPVTMQQVLTEIDKDEPNYAAAAALGPEALPSLQMIIDADDPLRAAKAAYAASLIGGPASVAVLKTAAAHRDPQVRIAAAHGLKNSADAAPSEVLGQLLEDHDSGVRKSALSTVGALRRSDLNDRVAAIAKQDPEEHLRTAAKAAVKQQKPR
jgi:HEAT repeat protein